MTNKTEQRPMYRVTMRPEPDTSDPSGIRRLRAFLKAALRSYRLRCTHVEPAPPETEESDGGDGTRRF